MGSGNEMLHTKRFIDENVIPHCFWTKRCEKVYISLTVVSLQFSIVQCYILNFLQWCWSRISYFLLLFNIMCATAFETNTWIIISSLSQPCIDLSSSIVLHCAL